MFFFVQTEDGSPSLRLGESENRSESMHSLRGAFSETVYIYGSAISTSLEKGFQPRIMSLGLGLGYVELLAAALILKDSRFIDTAEGESFEIVPELRRYFTTWVSHPDAPEDAPEGAIGVPPEFCAAYDDVLNRCSNETGVSPGEIRVFLARLIKEDRWKIREALGPETEFTKPFSCICFDAFSSKTTPELWSEEFLNWFFQKAAAPGCVLSTYACTGALKRSLRTAGFELNIREGFSSKRDSTFAVRG